MNFAILIYFEDKDDYVDSWLLHWLFNDAISYAEIIERQLTYSDVGL